MADSQVKTANICNITSGTTLYSNAGGLGTYIADNSISVHMASGNPASGIYAIPLSEPSVIGDKYTISFIPICATNTVLLIELAGVQRLITFTSGERKSVTIQASANNRNIAFYGGDGVDKTILIKDIQIEKGETATVYRPYSATGWQHSLRKLTTATDTITTLPVDIYADGNNATVGLKGNTVQNGTPTPDNPIMPQGCGERTANLCDESTIQQGYYGADTNYNVFTASNKYRAFSTHLSAGTYTINISATETIRLLRCSTDIDGVVNVQTDNRPYTFTLSADTTIYVSWRNSNTTDSFTDMKVMLNSGESPIPYEPYGYKIPISSAGQTNNIYLGEVETTRRVKKLVLTGEEDWVKASTPIGWHVYRLKINGYLRANANVPFCTHFYGIAPVAGSSLVEDLQTTFLISESGNNYYFIRDDSIETLADFKAYLAQQYANGTPVEVYYILESETTGIVNEPLMKIGDYADTVSGITIPVTAGGDTLSVDTTVQPSEVSLSYTGWHDATVKEWDGSQWNE